MTLCNHTQAISPEILQQLAELIVANANLNAMNEKLTAKNRELTLLLMQAGRKNREQKAELEEEQEKFAQLKHRLHIEIVKRQHMENTLDTWQNEARSKLEATRLLLQAQIAEQKAEEAASTLTETQDSARTVLNYTK